MATPRRRLGVAAGVVLAGLSLVVCGLGLAAMVGGSAPARATRFGVVGPLEGADAVHFGASIVLLGLLPLLAFARRPRIAAWLGTALGAALLANVFFGARLWA